MTKTFRAIIVGFAAASALMLAPVGWPSGTPTASIAIPAEYCVLAPSVTVAGKIVYGGGYYCVPAPDSAVS